MWVHMRADRAVCLLWGQGQVGRVPGSALSPWGCSPSQELHLSPSFGPLELKAVLCPLRKAEPPSLVREWK